MSGRGLYLLKSFALVSRSFSFRRQEGIGGLAPEHSARSAPKRKGNIMKAIAKVIESMLTKDATQQWTGQTSAVSSRDMWSWGGYAESRDMWSWGG